MQTSLLAFDQEQYQVTNTYTLTANDGQSFTFDTVAETLDFLNYYFTNPIATVFAYLLKNRKGSK